MSQVIASPAGFERAQWQTYSRNVRLTAGQRSCNVQFLDGPRLELARAGKASCDASVLVLNEVTGLSPRGDLGATEVEAAKSRIVRTGRYKNCTEAEVTQDMVFREKRQEVGLLFTFCELAASPLAPRPADPRAGVSGQGSGKAFRRALTRGKPLVYWIDPATPREWVDYVRRGIEDWEPAFRLAGFPRGIQARVAESNKPLLSPERSAYFHWIRSPLETASGNVVVDIRSGEILRSQIRFHEGALKRLIGNYFVRLSSLDPQAKAYPPSPGDIGKLIRMLVCHETGHTLGLAHNGKAAAGYPARKLREQGWLEEMHFSPTIMNYGMFNYVAQPEDGIAPRLLLSTLGPADIWTFGWLYGKRRPDWPSDQEQHPWLRASAFPPDLSDVEDRLDGIGTEDLTWTAEMGEQNLKRTVRLLPPNADSDLRARIIGQWMDLMVSVASVPGARRLVSIVPEHRYESVGRNQQIEALDFVIKQALSTPEFLIATDERPSATERIMTAQRVVLGTLLNKRRLDTMTLPEAPLKREEFIRILEDALFGGEPDAFRANLQRVFVEMLASRDLSNAAGDLTRLLPNADGGLASRIRDLLSGRVKPVIINDQPPAGMFPIR